MCEYRVLYDLIYAINLHWCYFRTVHHCHHHVTSQLSLFEIQEIILYWRRVHVELYSYWYWAFQTQTIYHLCTITIIYKHQWFRSWHRIYVSLLTLVNLKTSWDRTPTWCSLGSWLRLTKSVYFLDKKAQTIQHRHWYGCIQCLL